MIAIDRSELAVARLGSLTATYRKLKDEFLDEELGEMSEELENALGSTFFMGALAAVSMLEVVAQDTDASSHMHSALRLLMDQIEKVVGPCSAPNS